MKNSNIAKNLHHPVLASKHQPLSIPGTSQKPSNSGLLQKKGKNLKINNSSVTSSKKSPRISSNRPSNQPQTSNHKIVNVCKSNVNSNTKGNHIMSQTTTPRKQIQQSVKTFKKASVQNENQPIAALKPFDKRKMSMDYHENYSKSVKVSPKAYNQQIQNHTLQQSFIINQQPHMMATHRQTNSHSFVDIYAKQSAIKVDPLTGARIDQTFSNNGTSLRIPINEIENTKSQMFEIEAISPSLISQTQFAQQSKFRLQNRHDPNAFKLAQNSIYGYSGDSFDDTYDNTNTAREAKFQAKPNQSIHQSFINLIYPSMSKKLMAANNELATDRSSCVQPTGFKPGGHHKKSQSMLDGNESHVVSQPKHTPNNIALYKHGVQKINQSSYKKQQNVFNYSQRLRELLNDNEPESQQQQQPFKHHLFSQQPSPTASKSNILVHPNEFNLKTIEQKSLIKSTFEKVLGQNYQYLTINDHKVQSKNPKQEPQKQGKIIEHQFHQRKSSVSSNCNKNPVTLQPKAAKSNTQLNTPSNQNKMHTINLKPKMESQPSKTHLRKSSYGGNTHSSNNLQMKHQAVKNMNSQSFLGKAQPSTIETSKLTQRKQSIKVDLSDTRDQQIPTNYNLKPRKPIEREVSQLQLQQQQQHSQQPFVHREKKQHQPTQSKIAQNIKQQILNSSIVIQEQTVQPHQNQIQAPSHHQRSHSDYVNYANLNHQYLQYQMQQQQLQIQKNQQNFNKMLNLSETQEYYMNTNQQQMSHHHNLQHNQNQNSQSLFAKHDVDQRSQINSNQASNQQLHERRPSTSFLLQQYQHALYDAQQAANQKPILEPMQPKKHQKSHSFVDTSQVHHRFIDHKDQSKQAQQREQQPINFYHEDSAKHRQSNLMKITEASVEQFPIETIVEKSHPKKKAPVTIKNVQLFLNTTRDEQKDFMYMTTDPSLSPYTKDLTKLKKMIALNFKKFNEPPKTTSEFYRIGRVLGRGAFGKVNLACHKLSEQLVAIKSINKEFLKSEEEQRRKIMQEFAILKQSNHQSIVRLYDSFETNKHICFVMELCSGGDLLTYVRKRRKLKEDVAKYFFKQIIEGLAYIHNSKLIVHRDIKLDNILLDANGRIKICDFGVSKQVQSENERMTEQCGTPAYIAPEILRDKGYEGFKVDVWSAGVCLYAMLIGTVPFKAASMHELHHLIINGKYDLKDEKLSESAINLIKQLLEVDPKKRLSACEVLSHPWLKDTPEEMDIFTQKEKDTIHKEYLSKNIDRIEKQQQQETENIFTEYNLDTKTNGNSLLKNASTKSIILAPFNSTVSDFDEEAEKNFQWPEEIRKMIVPKRVLKFAPKCKDLDRQYEHNNNADLDNGVYNNFANDEDGDPQHNNSRSSSSDSLKKSFRETELSSDDEHAEQQIVETREQQMKQKSELQEFENQIKMKYLKYQEPVEIINMGIINQITNQGLYPKDYMIKSLNSKDMNYATATYHLLLKKDQLMAKLDLN